jgi:very-short-patch-repair endonuclease
MNPEQIQSSQKKNQQKNPHLFKAAREYRSQLVDNQTVAEKKINSLLRLLQYSFDTQYIIMGFNQFWVADFYIPDLNMVIELDGNQHLTPEGINKDIERANSFRELGFKNILRLTNYEVSQIDSAGLNKGINRVLGI